MRKTIAILLTIIYTCFTTGPLWSAPVASLIAIENSSGDSKETNEPEPLKHFEAPHFSKAVKNLPAKIKSSRAHVISFKLKKPFPNTSLSTIPAAAARDYIQYSTPLFIRNNVFRI